MQVHSSSDSSESANQLVTQMQYVHLRSAPSPSQMGDWEHPSLVYAPLLHVSWTPRQEASLGVNLLYPACYEGYLLHIRRKARLHIGK